MAMTIEPETKNWTWVLQRKCEECGFDTPSCPPGEIGRRAREATDPWPAFMAHPSAAARPHEDRWSALEYACHVRDAFRLGVYRVGRMLHEDNPRFDNWDQDETAVAERYDLQDPTTVGGEVLVAGHAFADLYDTVVGPQWGRPGLRSDGSPFTVDSFGRYFLHDIVHHVVDVQRGFAILES